MKVDAPPFPVTAPLPLQRRFGNDGQRPAGSFADLLAAMLCPATHRAEARAAELAPPIGSGGEPFERGRLLVETALAFRRPSQARDGYRADELLAIEPTEPKARSAAVSASEAVTVAEFLEQRLRELPSPVAQDVRVADRVRPTPVSQLRLSSSRPEPGPATRAAAPPARLGERPVDVERAANEVAHRAARKVPPFGAQLIAFEDGLRLLLRLPRLADGERAQLEAELARLLNSSGHRKHQIVIHEIAQGES